MAPDQPFNQCLFNQPASLNHQTLRLHCLLCAINHSYFIPCPVKAIQLHLHCYPLGFSLACTQLHKYCCQTWSIAHEALLNLFLNHCQEEPCHKLMNASHMSLVWSRGGWIWRPLAWIMPTHPPPPGTVASKEHAGVVTAASYRLAADDSAGGRCRVASCVWTPGIAMRATAGFSSSYANSKGVVGVASPSPSPDPTSSSFDMWFVRGSGLPVHGGLAVAAPAAC